MNHNLNCAAAGHFLANPSYYSIKAYDYPVHNKNFFLDSLKGQNSTQHVVNISFIVVAN